MTTLRFSVISLLIAAFLFIISLLFLLNEVIPKHETLNNDGNINDEHSSECRIVIVDQHHEVIPHWYQAARDGYIKEEGNILIHIDAHSDIAPAISYSGVKSFNSSIDPQENNFSHFMTQNDAFISPAALQGLIDYFIWISPSWISNNESPHHEKISIGHTDYDKICYCSFRDEPDNDIDDEDIIIDECFLLVRTSYFKENKKYISKVNCHIVKVLKSYFLSENDFEKVLPELTSKNIFIDIDEDYFGLESGIEVLINKGLDIELIEEIDELLSSLFCPKSNYEEELYNKFLRKYFSDLRQYRSFSNYTDIIKHIFKNITHNKPLCSKHEEYFIKQFTERILDFDNDILLHLADTYYCNTDSMQLKVHDNVFEICHGMVSPNDELNPVYIPSNDNIIRRADKLKEILNAINERSRFRFVSIGRSLRDGYVPRDKQRFIEQNILHSINNAISKSCSRIDYIYDEYLLFGKDGWV